MSSSELKFENLLNFRDVSSLLDQPSKLKPGKLYRSARPDEATPEDRLLLASTIKTIIDLRTPTEHIQQARKHASLARSSALNPAANSAPATGTPLENIPNITYKSINFNGPGFAKLMSSQLSWASYFHVIALMAAGYRTDAISIVARDVMAPRGVVGLMLDSLAACKAEVATAFNDVLADVEAYPVLVHCTQGKDRTGLIAMLALFLLGAGEEEVLRDYVESQERLAPEREERVKEIAEIGLGEEWADVEPRLVGEVKRWLEEEHGGVEGYLEWAGVSKETQERVKEILKA